MSNGLKRKNKVVRGWSNNEKYRLYLWQKDFNKKMAMLKECYMRWREIGSIVLGDYFNLGKKRLDRIECFLDEYIVRFGDEQGRMVKAVVEECKSNRGVDPYELVKRTSQTYRMSLAREMMPKKCKGMEALREVNDMMTFYLSAMSYALKEEGKLSHKKYDLELFVDKFSFYTESMVTTGLEHREIQECLLNEKGFSIRGA